MATGNAVAAGLAGFLVIAALGVALFFLMRSMNAQLRKVPKQFPPPDNSGRQDAGDDARDRVTPPDGRASS